MLIHLLIIIKNNLRANLLLMADCYFIVVCCGLCVCCGGEPTEIIRV